MCFGSTLSYPHKEFFNPRPSRTRPAASSTSARPAASSTRTRPAPARKAVGVPAPAPQLRVPATCAG